MNEKDVPVFPIWFALTIAWHYLAPGFSPYLRNIIGIVTTFVALCLFFPILKYWKIAVFLWGTVAGVLLFAEQFPKNRERHILWREKVTFLQDFLFTAGSFLIAVEIMILLD